MVNVAHHSSLQSREAICDASQGRVMASVSVVPKCGHLVRLSVFFTSDLRSEASQAVQENPDGVAQAILAAMQASWRSTGSKVHAAHL